MVVGKETRPWCELGLQYSAYSGVQLDHDDLPNSYFIVRYISSAELGFVLRLILINPDLHLIKIFLCIQFTLSYDRNAKYIPP